MPVLKIPLNGVFNFCSIKTVDTRKKGGGKKNYLSVIFVYLVNEFAYNR